jgi:hypothetical protein
MIPAYQAMDLYEHTCQRGWLHQVGAMLRGRSACLLDLATIAAGRTISARCYLGAQTVPIRQIRGSEGRCDDFDDAFHPLQQHTEGRWRGIARAWLQGASMPPVDLIRLGEIYFVRDGHHRISVARALGQQEIDAVVTVWQVPESHRSEWVPSGTSRRTSERLSDVKRWGVTMWSSLWRSWRGVQQDRSVRSRYPA